MTCSAGSDSHHCLVSVSASLFENEIGDIQRFNKVERPGFQGADRQIDQRFRRSFRPMAFIYVDTMAFGEDACDHGLGTDWPLRASGKEVEAVSKPHKIV